MIRSLVEEVNFKRLNEHAKIPTYGSLDAGCCDLYAAIDRPIAIAPHTTEKIGTGLAFELPRGTFAAIFARSGIATKRGLRPANCVGICDCDYRGEYIVALHNDTDFVQYVQPQERIAQMTLVPYIYMNFYEIEELSDTERGEGGFGSTGEK